MTEKSLLVGGKKFPGLCLASISLLLNEQAPFANESFSMSNIVCDNKHLLLGLSDGTLQLISWKGEFCGSFALDCRSWPSYETTESLNYLENGPSSELPSKILTSNCRAARSSAVVQLSLSLPLRLLVVLYSDAQLALCPLSKKGLKQSESIKAEKWLASDNAVCASIASEQQILAVGSRRGVVALYDLAQSASLLRTVSLYDSGYSMEDTGPVSCISWTPDNSAFAVG